ncbi:hypothetical protein CNO13_06540 (plasmid) [Borrelia miyamotoi]|uniref:Uncharacterized protein n=1 Tax=Borrelia miyamotoi TaxID=47466 RepID=A0AAQ3CNC4_9SPIR|nr:hypothetical protein [Borrelia miyamotoi]AHH05481.1 hypothetical protein BOM_0938 [Borrelia miyamotoi FR64b]WAZ70911.1 hypothetical protein O5403_04375 [Borrelia miyamotoi]WCB91008.1 hypothetical protein CNO11_07130 [Borrelia miyamotoi]WDE71643.1 hypothetical protein CNO13_06540 [Borrelia miyamotoi]WEG86031.1 hypothetical protein EZU67_07025 [Borrelia miyamotoi]
MIINLLSHFRDSLELSILDRKEKDVSESKLINCTKVSNYKEKEKVVLGSIDDKVF